jgi:hypothetical protein
VQNLMIEGNGGSSPDQGSIALFEAAKLVRQHGMELIGAEVEPDWHIHDGQFEEGVTIASRGTNDSTTVLFATDEELERAHQHRVVPDERFHYRYQAAALAWEAAALMPNNAADTARILCTAGSWLKNIDAQSADVFYKSLVRRCRKTDIGELADRMRWFPDLDANGNPVPWEPDPHREIEPPSAESSGDPNEHPTGYWYVLNRGNTLQDVVDAARTTHQLTLTVAELRQANQSTNPNRLKAGLRIFVPAPLPENTQNPEQETLPTIPDVRPHDS